MYSGQYVNQYKNHTQLQKFYNFTVSQESRRKDAYLQDLAACC